MKAQIALILVIVFSISFQACKDDTSSPSANKLCEGDGSSSYWPLTLGNTWKYRYELNGVLQSDTPTLSVFGDSTIKDKTFFGLSDNHFWSEVHYYRQDPATGDILSLVVSSNREFVDIPANPELGFSWSNNFATREITGVDVSISTKYCEYTDVLEITHNSATNDRVFYYKKGLGMVKIIAYEGGGTRHVYELMHVELH